MTSLHTAKCCFKQSKVFSLDVTLPPDEKTTWRLYSLKIMSDQTSWPASHSHRTLRLDGNLEYCTHHRIRRVKVYLYNKRFNFVFFCRHQSQPTQRLRLQHNDDRANRRKKKRRHILDCKGGEPFLWAHLTYCCRILKTRRRKGDFRQKHVYWPPAIVLMIISI